MGFEIPLTHNMHMTSNGAFLLRILGLIIYASMSLS
jgi:hypothetical protein